MKKKSRSGRSKPTESGLKKKGHPPPAGKKPRSTRLRPGKLPSTLLEKCLSEAVLEDPWVVQGPGTGADAAIVHPSEDFLVISSDPVTFTPADSGEHLLSIIVNDIVTTGAYPRWLSLTYLLPVGTTEASVKSLFRSLGKACQRHEISLLGGHTEVTDAVTRPVAVGTVIGMLRKDRRVDPSRCQPGDPVMLIGPAAIEGTAVLAIEKKAEVIEALGEEFQAQAAALLKNPGICVREPAILASGRYLVHALHDPTEGGIATALRELSAFTGHGLKIEREKIPVLPETQAICQLFDIHPLGLLASGSLLAVFEKDEAHRFLAALQKHLDLRATIIGELTTETASLWRESGEDWMPIPEFTQDELLKVLAGDS